MAKRARGVGRPKGSGNGLTEKHNIAFSKELSTLIRAEARERETSFAHVVRDLAREHFLTQPA